MYTKNVFAVSGALLTVVAAVPMAKRDVVWVTETDEAVVTVPVTQTVWVNPGETVPTEPAHFGHHHSHSKVTTHVQSTVTVPASPASTESSAESTSVYVAPSSSYEAPSSSSVYVAPTPSSTSIYVAPTTSTYVAPTSTYVAPTSTYVAPTSTYSPPAATSSAASSSGGSSNTGAAAPGTEYTGDLTWYDTGLGACGVTSTASQAIVAIAESLFDQYTPSSGLHAGNPNDNTLCGKTVTITGVDGSPYTATIVDRCTGCAESDLDLSEDFFNTVTDNGNGRVHNMSWKFD